MTSAVAENNAVNTVTDAQVKLALEWFQKDAEAFDAFIAYLDKPNLDTKRVKLETKTSLASTSQALAKECDGVESTIDAAKREASSRFFSRKKKK